MPTGTVMNANRNVVLTLSRNCCDVRTSRYWSKPTYLLGRPGNGGLRKKPRYTLCTSGQNTKTPKIRSDGISRR